MTELGIEITPRKIKNYTTAWWQSNRTKAKGGLWLTEQGFEALKKADIKHYKIRFEQPLDSFENRFIIWLDNTIECPFFLTKWEIYVFGEKTAVQMILFSGDLKMWHNTYTKKKLTTT